jgi:pyridoxamine 5'-phosphate oxidase
MTRKIADLRKDYRLSALSEAGVVADPLEQFQRWLQEAVTAELPEPNAMVLATSDRYGRPSARVVLLKGLAAGSFVFFTHYRSAKGRQLSENPLAALVFLWHELERQVRVEGSVSPVSSEESLAYFRSRPRASQLGALASNQSQVVASRQVLEERFAELERRHKGGDIPLPEHWGGYCLTPIMLEFWQGRPNRLHDRLRYALQVDGSWLIERLEP